jgi:hypothetical protein
MLSKAGSMLTRNRIFDEFVFSPERLDFVVGAIIPEGWTQNRPEPVYVPGGVFDPTTLPDSTDAKREQRDTLIDAAKQAIAGTAEKTRTKYIDTKADDLHKRKPDIPLNQCRTTITRACSKGDLYGDFEIYLDSGGIIPVAKIIKNPQKYDCVTCHDPIEPENTAGKAQIYMNQKDEKPVIKSFWHGDQEHLHFRMLKSGFSQRQIVLFLSLVSLSFGSW